MGTHSGMAGDGFWFHIEVLPRMLRDGPTAAEPLASPKGDLGELPPWTECLAYESLGPAQGVRCLNESRTFPPEFEGSVGWFLVQARRENRGKAPVSVKKLRTAE